MKRRNLLASSLAPLALTACASLRGAAPQAEASAPSTPREFRGAWVATVANIDWPSKKGLSTAEQQAEARALLDTAARLGLTAIIFQVRTSADAFYDSRLEPWSEYLSGTQGQAPSPFYDPLAFWIAEAHQRGIELHAWFNPFRARQSNAHAQQAASHVANTHPEWVKSYGDQLWIDPGEPAAADHTLEVFCDVIRRYDIDALHIDDYFYPYPVKGADGATDLDFPDEPSWQAYRASGGNLARADWRRSNVDTLIARIHEAARALKPGLRFGISPFGLGKPALRPAGISGFSQYDALYADVERWLANGWADYIVPQLYWPRAQAAHSFELLLDYWHGAAANPRGVPVYAGMFTSRVTGKDGGWPVDEILGQIAIQRAHAPGSGHCHFSLIALHENRGGIADALLAGPYATAAAAAPASAVPVGPVG